MSKNPIRENAQANAMAQQAMAQQEAVMQAQNEALAQLRFIDFKQCRVVPVGKQMLIELINEPPTTAAGLYRGSEEREQPMCGYVHAVGSEVDRCVVGDVVMMGVGGIAGFKTADGVRGLMHNDGVQAVIEGMVEGAGPEIHEAPGVSRILQAKLVGPSGGLS